MSDLPSGLASISARLDDSPQVRGAVAFGRIVRERGEGAARLGEPLPAAGISVARSKLHILVEPGPVGCCDTGLTGPPGDITSAIDRHAALAIGSGYKGRDQR